MEGQSTIERPPLATGPDVDMLVQHFGVPTEGSVIPHSSIETILGLPRDTPGGRYWTIMAAWKARMFSAANTFLRAVPGVGYLACQPLRRIESCEGLHAAALRRVQFSADVARQTNTKGLSPVDRARRDHLLLTSAVHLAIAQADGKSIQAQVRKALSAGTGRS
jgi:hypothetical protein